MANVNEQPSWPAAKQAMDWYNKCVKLHGQGSWQAKEAAQAFIDKANAASTEAGHGNMLSLSLLGY